MKLVLTSGGFTTPEIVRATAALTGKAAAEISVAVINEGYVAESGDHRWVVDELATMARSFGGNVELLNLRVPDPDAAATRASAADVLYVMGGPNDYVMDVMRTSGFAQRLPGLLADTVYVGSSAGAMVLGRRIPTAGYELVYTGHVHCGVQEYLDIVDFAVMPHLGSPIFPHCTEQSLRQAAAGFSGTMYGLRDDAALVVAGGRVHQIGTPALVLS